MRRAITMLIFVFMATCNTVSVLEADEARPRIVLKVRMQIENEHGISTVGSTTMLSSDDDYSHKVEIGAYTIDVLISDLQAYELVFDLTLKNSEETAIDSTQVLAPAKSETEFRLSASKVTVSGTIGIMNLSNTVKNDE